MVDAARACLIEPDAVADLSVAQRLAETSLSRRPLDAWNHYAVGLVAFRAGRYERAIESTLKSLDLGARWIAAPLNHPVLAMAHHRLGHREEARQWLEQAHGRRGDARSRRRVEYLASSGAWWDRLEFQLLLREADAMVLDAAFPADPFAP
jgi:hypothetical protein